MLRTVTLPIVLPAILAGALLVFIETLENFGVPFVLAEDKPILAVEAYKLFVGETGGNPASAGVLGVLLIVCTVLALLVQRRFLARRRFATGARRSRAAAGRQPGGCAGSAPAYCWSVVARGAGAVLRRRRDLVHGVPRAGAACRLLASTISRSCSSARTGRSPTRCCWRPRRPCGATLIGVPIGYVVTRYRSRLSALLDVVATSPFAVAGTVLGIGLVMAFNSGLLVLTGGWLIMVLAYMVRKLPFAVRSASAILHQIDPSLEEASINLGVLAAA